jgi:hypothetical protein
MHIIGMEQCQFFISGIFHTQIITKPTTYDTEQYKEKNEKTGLAVLTNIVQKTIKAPAGAYDNC